MYDHATESLWSTLQGEPVVGPLVGKGIQLKRHYVVTTKWGKWKTLHPDTSVLSLDTGHKRDYGEGVAYQEYFATDNLMYGVPTTDKRLANKDPVFALRNGDHQLAIAIDFLKLNSVYQNKVGDLPIVVFSDTAGTSRAYESPGTRFASWDGVETAVDADGNSWKVTEAALSKGDQSQPRVPSHRAFWFGWHAQYPDTELVK